LILLIAYLKHIHGSERTTADYRKHAHHAHDDPLG
jgi:hypothetical protein